MNKEMTFWNVSEKGYEQFRKWIFSRNVHNSIGTEWNGIYNTLFVTINDEKAYILFCLTFQKIAVLQIDGCTLFKFPENLI